MGEEPFHFKFTTSGGKYHLKAGDRNLTAYGGLVAWDHFIARTGVFDSLTASYPIARTSPNVSEGNAAPHEISRRSRRQPYSRAMSFSSVTMPWRVTDVTFVEIEIRNPSDRQLRVEFGCGLRLVITGASPVPLAATLIEALRAGKEVAQ